jgi:hypothetical protein
VSPITPARRPEVSSTVSLVIADPTVGPRLAINMRAIAVGRAHAYRRAAPRARLDHSSGVEPEADGGCSGCAMFIDNVGHLAHLNEPDTAFVLVSAAPINAIERYKSRMSGDITWFRTLDDFSADFGVDEYVGLNVSIRADDRTYFTNGRAAAYAAVSRASLN